MTKKQRIKKIAIRITAVIVAVAITVTAVYFLYDGNSKVKIIKSVETRNTITNPSDDYTVHYAQDMSSFSIKAASSGLIELYVDKDSVSFGILESGTNNLWSALPLLDGIIQPDKMTHDSSVVSLEIIGGTDVYYLNSQDNSLAYNKASYKLTDDGAEFTYDIFSDSKTAKKKDYSESDIGFRIKLSVKLIDGNMTVECEHSNLTNNPDAFIENIVLLNSFGAYNTSYEDDFILVPDGSGAIIKTSVYDEAFDSLSFAVYGNDPAVSSGASGNAIIPAFGMKHGETAFVSLIQDGDTVASIKADKAKSLNEFNRVYSSFNITPTLYEDEKLYISKESSVDEISLCYRFLTGNNATYAGLASACREQLIRNSVLSTKTVTSEDYLPCFLSLTGATTDDSGVFDKLVPMTDFEQAADMLSRMKSKGINNISVRYSGIFNGGVNSENPSDLKINKAVGGEEGLAELYDYIKTQKMSLYFDINLLSDSSTVAFNSAKNIKLKDFKYKPYLTFEYLQTPVYAKEFINVEKLNDIIVSVLSKTEGLEFSGFSLNDLGTVLYSDYSSNGMSRQDSAEIISSSVAPLSTNHSTMAVTGNFYMIKNVNKIVNMPMKPSVARSGAYISVPFVPMVLHGIVDYTGLPINTEVNMQETMLKYIEYGACPHFEWNYEPIDKDAESDIYYYDNTINAAAEFYTKANAALYDLRDARMTDHYEVENGIFCTEYDTGAMIYVNYTDSDFTILGVVVEANDFMRIN